MANLSHIDMSDAQELGAGFRIVPPGEYQIYIENSEFKPTKDNKAGKNNAEFLELTAVVADGEYEGAKIPIRLNLINPSQTTVDIAKSHLRALCEAIVGQPFVNDSPQLHNRPFFALIDNVPMNKDDPNSKRSNEVVFRKGTIRSITSTVVPVATAVAHKQQEVAQASVATPSSGLPPWKQKKSV